MKNILFISLMLFTASCYAQFDYETFESYNTPSLKKQNARIKSVKGFYMIKGVPVKMSSYKEFSPLGLPTKIVGFDSNFDELKTTEFLYTNSGQPTTINTFQQGKKFTTSEFYYDSANRLQYIKEYVYSSMDGKKMLNSKSEFEYYDNKKIKSIVSLTVSDILPIRDTVELLLFDTSGIKTDSYFDMAGYSQHVIYKWNEDKTEMREYDYHRDSLYNTIIHKYRGVLEIEQRDSGSKKPPVFWKYDRQNRLVQTNASLFFTQDFVYSPEGYLISEKWTATFPELASDSEFKSMLFKYEYHFRQ